jgi:hypothetical protein
MERITRTKINLLIASCVAMTAAVFSDGALAEPHPPNNSGYCYGDVVDDTHGCSILFANQNWVTLWYAFAGFEDKLPSPGYIRIASTKDLRQSPDGFLFRLKGGKTISAEGNPYFRLPVSSVLEIAKDPAVTVEALYDENRGAAKPLAIRLDSTTLNNFRRLAETGATWAAGDQPWLGGGNIGFIVDTSAAMKANLAKIRACLRDRLKRRITKLDQFAIVYGNGDNVVSLPSTSHGIGRFDPANSHDYTAADDAIARLQFNEPSSIPLDELLRVALAQEAKTIVVFAADGPRPIDEKRITAQLADSGARLVLVWFGNSEVLCEKLQKLKAVVETTRGGTVTITQNDARP